MAGVDQPTAPVAHVLVVGLNEQRAPDVVAEIEHGGGGAAYRLTTLADVTSARELAKWATGAALLEGRWRSVWVAKPGGLR